MKKNVKMHITLTIIATIAIVWYLLQSFNGLTNIWSLPLLAAITGVTAVILPFLARRVRPLNAVISAGIALLFMIMVLAFLPAAMKFWTLFTIIFIVALATEVMVHGWGVIHLGELILDFLFSLLATWLITNLNGPVLTVIVLVLTYVAVLSFDLDFAFSLKRSDNGESKKDAKSAE